MKISEIVADLKELKATISSFLANKASATDIALTGFQTKLTGLETATVAELTQKTADLTAAQGSILVLTTRAEKAEADFKLVSTALATACANMKLNVKDGASASEMITAMESGVATTLSKMGIKAENIPAAAPAKSPEGEKKTMARAEFEALAPGARMDFMRKGGRLAD